MIIIRKRTLVDLAKHGFFIKIKFIFADTFFFVTMVTGDEPDDADLDAPKIYEPIPSLDELAEKLNGYMEQYNETVRGGKMDLVFFKVSNGFFSYNKKIICSI
jgi:dynein heavy chain